MRFLVLIHIDETTGQRPDERLIAEITTLMKDMQQAGVLVETDGLLPTAQAKRIRTTKGKISTTDGPFTEAKEVVGGYFMLEAPSLDDATAWMQRFVAAHGTDWTMACEIRQLGGYTRS